MAGAGRPAREARKNMLIDMKELREKKEILAKEAAKGASVLSLILKGSARYESGDYEQAEELFRKAAEAGCAEAALLLGRLLYLDQREVYEGCECLKWLTQAEAAGYVEARRLLVDLYCELECPEEAERWYFTGPEPMDAEALNQIGACYLSVLLSPFEKHLTSFDPYFTYDPDEDTLSLEGTRMYLRRAYEFFSLAAARGCHEAELNLGKVLSHLFFPGRDLDKAVAHYLKAARHGYREGLLLAARLEEDRGELESAEKHYLKAIEDGSTDAMLELARFLEEQEGGARQREAIGWLKRAASYGDCYALYKLGLRLIEGRGVARDVSKGVRCVVEAEAKSFWSLVERDELEAAAADLDPEEAWPLRRFLASRT